MRLEYNLRPNVMRTNARYRGPSESEKYHNFVNEIIHDMNLLGRVIDEDKVNAKPGQTNYINDNLAIYFSGDAGQMYSTTPTATTITKLESPAIENVDFANAAWVAHGNCTKTIDTLESNGTGDPCGVSYTLNVQEGQVIYIRALAELVSGTVNGFTIGSSNVNQGEGSTKSFKITSDEAYIGHFIVCRHKESITIDIDVSRGTSTTGKVKLSDVSIFYVSQGSLHLQPVNTVLKSNLNVLEKDIMNIINNM